jgi:hypothetical protein
MALHLLAVVPWRASLLSAFHPSGAGLQQFADHRPELFPFFRKFLVQTLPGDRVLPEGNALNPAEHRLHLAADDFDPLGRVRPQQPVFNQAAVNVDPVTRLNKPSLFRPARDPLDKLCDAAAYCTVAITLLVLLPVMAMSLRTNCPASAESPVSRHTAAFLPILLVLSKSRSALFDEGSQEGTGVAEGRDGDVIPCPGSRHEKQRPFSFFVFRSGGGVTLH